MVNALPSFRTPATLAALLVTGTFAAPARAQQPPPPPPQVFVIPPADAPPPVVFGPRAPLGPADVAQWEEGDAVPYGYRPVKSVRKPLVIAGAVTFGSLYLTSALAGAIATDAGAPGGASLFVPVLGPFIAAGLQSSATGGFLLVLDGLAQGAGVAMFVVGLAKQKTVLRRSFEPTVVPVPMTFGASSGGVGLRGTF
jgi:hypothetical protein